MIIERFPEKFDRSGLQIQSKNASSRRTMQIMLSAFPESTRRDLLKSYLIYPWNMVSESFTWGSDTCFPDAVDAMFPVAAASPYLLYVGSRGGYKNFEGLLRAVASSHFLKNNFSIICFGGGTFTQNEVILIDELGLEAGKIKQIGGGDDMLALQLYKDLPEAFISPLTLRRFWHSTFRGDVSWVPGYL